MDYCNTTSLTKKLLYQSKNRGCKEIGLILGKFAEKFLANMDGASLADFALILNQNDIDIYDWITNKTAPPSHLNSKIMLQIYSSALKNWSVKQGVSVLGVDKLREYANSQKFCGANSLKQKSILSFDINNIEA